MKFQVLTTISSALLLSAVCPAQEKIKQVVTSDYNRNSISIVGVERGDSHDSQTLRAVSSYKTGEKFDVNRIRTKTIRLSRPRSESSYQEDINAAVAKENFGQEILASIFNRDGNGVMNDKTVRYRGNYDAKDQDIINARASRVGVEALGDAGHKLVSRSYILFPDFYNIKSSTDRNGKTSWSTSGKLYAYKLDLTPERLNEFYEQCWIYDDDDPATRNEKIRAFRNFATSIVPVGVASSSGSGASVTDAASSCLSSMLFSLESKIPEWNVAVTILSRHPLQAKIGTKEGLKNGDRYRAYSYREDRDGNLVSVKRGFLRATEIAANTGMSSGATEPSKFYQVSGVANIEEGWTIKQSNDYKIGVMAGVKLGAVGKTALAIDIDYLMKQNTGGSASYLLFGGTFELGGTGNYSAFNMNLGYGYGLHLTRFIELMPYATIGLDHLGLSNDDSSTNDARFFRSSALVLEPGARVAVNVAYPLQVYAKLGYDVLIYTETLNNIYYSYNKYMESQGLNSRHSGVFLQAGLKWTF